MRGFGWVATICPTTVCVRVRVPAVCACTCVCVCVDVFPSCHHCHPVLVLADRMLQPPQHAGSRRVGRGRSQPSLSPRPSGTELTHVFLRERPRP